MSYDDSWSCQACGPDIFQTVPSVSPSQSPSPSWPAHPKYWVIGGVITAIVLALWFLAVLVGRR